MCNVSDYGFGLVCKLSEVRMYVRMYHWISNIIHKRMTPAVRSYICHKCQYWHEDLPSMAISNTVTCIHAIRKWLLVYYIECYCAYVQITFVHF